MYGHNICISRHKSQIDLWMSKSKLGNSNILERFDNQAPLKKYDILGHIVVYS